MRNKILFLIVLLVILITPINSIFVQRDKFFSTGFSKNYNDYKKAYESSQYVKKNNPGIIPDETFESFAAGAFLKGLNPILIVHDHPPLGRYILSLSIILFDNVHTAIPIALGISLLGIFLITRLLTKNNFISLIPVAIFANESLFLNKFQYTPLPEPIQLPFIIFAFYFFMKAMHEKNDSKYFVLTSIMLGCIISIRFFVLGSVVGAAMFAVLLDRRRLDLKFKKFIFTLPISLLILIISYTRTIIDSGNIFQVFSIQKYILSYHSTKFILPFTFWDLLFFNKWHTWWGSREISSDPQWNIFWPITYSLSILSFIILKFKKVEISYGEKVLFIYILLLSLMLSTGYTSTRYFLPLLPFIYILSSSLVFKFIKLHYVRKNKKK